MQASDHTEKGDKMLKEVYQRARVVTSGGYLTTINELTDQIPALRPRVLWSAAHELIKLGAFTSNKILSEEDKGAPLSTAVSLITGLPLAMARWYPYKLLEELALPIESEYYRGYLYVNGIEKGDKVTIVDDTISTGGTIISLVKAIQARNATVEEILALVEKVENNGVNKVKESTGIEVKSVLKIKVTTEGVIVL